MGGVFKKLTIGQLFKKFLDFVEPEMSLPCSK
jgi:hypothetical protein